MNESEIKRYSLSKQVSDLLEKKIENGEYKVGEKIPTEVVLMEIFNVSRNTVREAVQSLVSAGILVVRQGDGTYVKSNNRFDANMSQKLELVSYDKINEARKIFESEFASLAAERRTEEDLANIKEALAKRQQLEEHSKEHTIADINFHLEIAKACHNSVLLDLYKSLYSFLIQHIESRNLKTELSHRQVDKLHEDLYKAINDQNPEKAKKVAKKILAI